MGADREKGGILPNLVSNGCVDFRGHLADKSKTGGWQSAPYIIVNEVAERLSFFAIAVTMVQYLVRVMHLHLPDAATTTTNWTGSSHMLTLLGAYLADAYLGRFKTIIIFSFIHAVGMILLTLSATQSNMHPPTCLDPEACQPASSSQMGFLFIALAFIALGTGGIKPCVSSFGADQFDEHDKKENREKSAFFNWFFFAINIGSIFGLTVMVYIQSTMGWSWGFGLPTIGTIVSILILASGFRFYRYQKPMGSALSRFVQVLVASVRNHLRGVKVENAMDLYEVDTKESDIVGARKLPHTQQYRFLDKAAVLTGNEVSKTDRWRLCTVTQVEEFKCVVRVLPVWASTIALSISFAQVSTFFVSQAVIMDRKLPNTSFVVPAGSMPVFNAVSALIVVPLYEAVIVPILRKHTGHRRGITSQQRMGVGFFVSIFAMVAAAVIEKKRRTTFNPATVSVFWLVPQFFIIGGAEVFSYVAQLEFFYDEATDGTRSLSSALFLCEFGVGSWLSSLLVKIIEAATGGEEKGWLRNSLNESHLDYFYWVLVAISVVNFVIFLVVASRYKGRNGLDSSMQDVVSDEDN